MAIKRPKGARPDRKPRRALGIKCGFKLPNTYPTGVPYVVTRYLSEQGSQAYKDDEEKGALVIPCRITGHQENGSTYDFHVEIEPQERHESRRMSVHDPDTDAEVMAFAPWTFKIGRRERKTIEAFQKLRSPVTVIRLPEVEIGRPLPDALPYGVNPRFVSIRLAMNESSILEREAKEAELGFAPDFNCFTEDFQVWDNKANAPFCKGNGEWAERRDPENGSINKVRCIPWVKDPETGDPNPHVCQYRGRWNGTNFAKPKNPCGEAIQFAFRVAGVPTLWIYQIFTKSPTTAGNIRPMLQSVLEFRPDGNVMGFPMVLSVEWKTFTPTVNGKQFKTEKPVWKLDVDGKVITSLDRGSVNALLDGTTSRSLPAPAALVDMTAGGDDLSEYYPDTPPAETEPAPLSWVDFMFGNDDALVVFRELGYTRRKGREVLDAYEKKYPGKSNQEMTPGFLKLLRAAATKKRKAAEAEPEPDRHTTRRAKQEEPEPEPQVDVIDPQGHLVTDQQGLDDLPEESDFI